MKVKITTTIENVVDISQIAGLSKKDLKRQLKKDIKIAKNAIAKSIIESTKEVINTKSHRKCLNHLKASAIQNFDDSLDALLDNL